MVYSNEFGRREATIHNMKRKFDNNDASGSDDEVLRVIIDPDGSKGWE